MAVQTWYMNADAVSGHGTSTGGLLTATDTGAEATLTAGWTVAKVAPTVYAPLLIATESGSGSFGATVLPSGSSPVGSQDFLSTESFLTGTFAAGIYAATFKVIAVTSGGDQDGNVNYRLWKCDSTFTTFTQLTSSVVTCGAVTNLLTTVAQTSSGSTPSIGPFTLTNEALLIEIAWKITGAGGATTRDVILRKGTGITLVTPNFTATAAGTTYTKAGHGVEHG